MGRVSGVQLPELGGLAMGRVYPPDSKQEFLDTQEGVNEPPLRGEEYEDDECSDGVLSLLEENARLRWACGQANGNHPQKRR
jgi:hypothetical protein